MKKIVSQDPATRIQDNLNFGEFGGVNPSITDSSTFTFLNPEKMEEAFEHEIEGCFLYSRPWNPINKYLAGALSKLENSESAQVTSSGMSAISCSILQLCGSGDEIITSNTIYGGTYALFRNFLTRFGIRIHFVDIQDLKSISEKINKNTKIIYCESISNPLLNIPDLAKIGKLSKKHGIKLIVDNTFSPMIMSPIDLGADIVVHSLTKFINGAGDCVAGAICSDSTIINRLIDVEHGATMLLGPVLDSFRSASILKNLHTLHIRMKKHSSNALYLAENIEKLGLKVFYPGLNSHKTHDLIKRYMNPGYGFGGMLAIDVGDAKSANKLMTDLQKRLVGYLAVSLGFYKTLFSLPSHSTSSEIPPEEQHAIGLSEGLVRFSIGLDNDIERTFKIMKKCFEAI